jgi:hypothetical protein
VLSLKGCRVSFVASIPTFTNSADVPIATSIDASHCDHKITFLYDDFTARKDMSADQRHCAVSKFSEIYGGEHETTNWIASTLPRKRADGKKAGG